MKLLAITSILVITTYFTSLNAADRVNLPVKSHSFVSEGKPQHLLPVFLAKPQNKDGLAVNNILDHSSDEATGVAEVLVGGIILFAGVTALGHGALTSIFRPEDIRYQIIAYSAGTGGTILGIFLISDGFSRLNFQGWAPQTNASPGKPGVYHSK